MQFEKDSNLRPTQSRVRHGYQGQYVKPLRHQTTYLLTIKNLFVFSNSHMKTFYMTRWW